MNVNEAQVLSRETLDKAFEQLLKPNLKLKAEQARRDVALAKALMRETEGETK